MNKNNIRETKSKESAITLIALVITIIVLLILAGISIATLTGENGIFDQANNAKEKTIIGKEQEIVDLSVAAIRGQELEKNISILSEKTLEEEVEKNNNGEDVVVVKKGENLSVTFSDTKHEYLVPTNETSNLTNLADVAKVGDFISYDAGIWTQEEIDKIKKDGHYTDGSLPCGNFQFGGFTSGQSRNNAINADEDSNIESNEKLNKGWRILSINDGTIKIVSTGTVEAYSFSQGTTYSDIQGGALSEFILMNNVSSLNNKTREDYVNLGIKARDFTMYENDLAVSGTAHCMNFTEMYTLTNSLEKTDNDLRNIGAYYYISRIPSAGASQGLIRVYPDGSVYSVTNMQHGIRIVLTLKENIKVTKDNQGDGSSYDKAWKITL